MSINEKFHIHISISNKGNLQIERVYTDTETPNELMCSVAVTNQQEEGYEPINYEYVEVVIEGTEMRLMPTSDGTVIAVLTP